MAGQYSIVPQISLPAPGEITRKWQSDPSRFRAFPAHSPRQLKNLKVIYLAIQAYQTDHKDLPDWLSDLMHPDCDA